MYYRRQQELQRICRNISQTTKFSQTGYYFSTRKNRYLRIKYGKYRKFLKKNCNKKFRQHSKTLSSQLNPGEYKRYSEFWYNLI